MLREVLHRDSPYGIIGEMAQANTKRTRARSYARNRAQATTRVKDAFVEADSTYFLKLVCVALIATLWIKLQTPISWQGFPIGALPVGTVVGLIGIRLLEKNPYDRRIWYAVLIIVTIITFFSPAGIII